MRIIEDTNAKIVQNEGKFIIIDTSTNKWHEDVALEDRQGFLTYDDALACMNKTI